ncbi:MAG: hypothetical protein ACOH2V_00410 [Candidatus Saccharimonadaceae bacterium]
MKAPLLKGIDSRKSEEYLDMERLPNVWLYGDAHNINGYDFIQGNIAAFKHCLEVSAFLSDIVLLDGEKYRALVQVVHSRHSHILGLVCLVEKLEDVKEAYEYLGITCPPIMFTHDWEELAVEYRDVYKLLKSIAPNSPSSDVFNGC